MSGATDALSRQISSAKDLGTVVRTMKTLAASSVGQYEKAVESLEAYYRTIELGLSECLRQMQPTAGAAAPRRAAPRALGAVVFGADQGLVGRFNEVLLEFTLRGLQSQPGRLTRLWAVGERMQSLAADTPQLSAPAAASMAVLPHLSVPGSVETIAPTVRRILVDIQALNARGELDAIHLFYNHSKGGAAYEPVTKQLLPFDSDWRQRLIALPWPTRAVPEVIGDAGATLAALIREYLFVLLFQACAESLASENASRLAAMQRAERSIREILQQLTSTFHRVRQESIDEELFEVIAGYDAMPG